MTNIHQPIVRIRSRSSPTGFLLRISVHLVGLLPLLQLIFYWLTDGLTVNPIQFVEQFLGRAAANLLVVSLAVTPIVTLTGWRKLSKHRRALGLYAFAYFALHFLTFAVLDYGLDLPEMIRLTVEKPFILFGFLAGLILLALAITSFKYWMKKMGKNWQRLHKLVYLAGGLMVVHYALAVKGSFATLSGDIIRPLIMGSIVTLLLVLRVPAIRRLVISLRSRVKA